jgi:hypothetical protein
MSYAVGHPITCGTDFVVGPTPSDGKPGESGPNQGNRDRIIDGLLSKVAEKHSAAALGRIVDQAVDDLARCHPGAKLLERFGNSRSLSLGFAFKLLAGAHGPTSVVASPPKRLPGFDE